MSRTHRIAVIPGDGIGTEVVPEGLRVLDAAADRVRPRPRTTSTSTTPAPTTTSSTGKMLPDNWFETTARVRRDLLRRGRLARRRARPHLAVGQPAAVPPGLRPVREPAAGPVDARGAQPAGRARTRRRRLLRRAREHRRRILQRRREDLRRHRPRDRDAGNGHDPHRGRPDPQVRLRPRRRPAPASTSPRRPRATASRSRCPTGTSASRRWPPPTPTSTVDKFHIDILTANFVMHPDWFDVVVASNLFGDILSDLGPACTGTIGIAPSANINPERITPACSNPCTAPPPTSPGAGSPTRSARSGAPA